MLVSARILKDGRLNVPVTVRSELGMEPEYNVVIDVKSLEDVVIESSSEGNNFGGRL